jgi:hypothetical protein
LFGDMSAHSVTSVRRGTRFLLIVGILAVSAGFAWYFFGPNRRLAFDPVVWKRDNAAAFRHASYDQIYQATRDRMVDDLLKRHHLIGVAKAEATALLGEPDFSRSEPFPNCDLIYWLGPDDRGPMGHLDSLWLVMRCDTNGRTVQCRKTYD